MCRLIVRAFSHSCVRCVLGGSGHVRGHPGNECPLSGAADRILSALMQLGYTQVVGSANLRFHLRREKSEEAGAWYRERYMKLVSDWKGSEVRLPNILE